MTGKIEKGVIEVDPRHTMRSIKSAIQGNVIKTLVELITNSNDSYTRIEESGNNINGEILISYEKIGNRGNFSVIDNAEGMSHDDIKQKLTKYGVAASGLLNGFSVRGYFGQGAKDALISMINGEIHSIKDGIYTCCKLYEENHEPKYAIESSIPATKQLRRKVLIPENGTTAKFSADPEFGITVPRLSTIQEEIANNYQLRKILMNDKRKIFLKSSAEKKQRHLKYKLPPGKEIRLEEFVINYGDYPEFKITLSIWRSETELTQNGENRSGGLLIVDENDNVLGISMFKFENEPLASHYFGEMRIEGFRELLKNEEPVLKDERTSDGLDRTHPFCKELIGKTDSILQFVIDEEKKRKEQDSLIRMDKESRERFKKAFDILNEIAEIEAKDVENLGGNTTNELEPPPNGFCIYPSFATVTVGKKYNLRLRIDTRKVLHSSKIIINSTSQALKLITNEIVLNKNTDDQIIDKHVTFEATAPNQSGKIIAELGKKTTSSEINTIPEKEFLYSEGMVFIPQSITLHPNHPRKVELYIYTKIIPGGSEIKISSDNESINASTDEIIVNDALADKHVYKTNIEVWGDSINEKGIISADYQNCSLALLDVRVTSKPEEEEKGFKGLFKDYEYSFENDPLQRVSYSRETGKIIIYGEFPSVKYYIGDLGTYSNTLSAQVFVADLVSETCFREIAKRKVEKSGALINPEGKYEMINRETFVFSKKYGYKLHQVLVNQNLIVEDRLKVKSSRKN